MASKIFSNKTSKRLQPTDTFNNAGGQAYKLGDATALAQLAATGMLGDTFYVSAEDQLDQVLKLANGCAPEFLARVAVYSRESGKMKDMPAILCAVLFSRGENALLEKVFPRVIDNGRMLRNFVQIVRSGKTGRKSLGTFGKKLVQGYFDAKSPERLFKDTVGNDPSLADVIKLAHPRPTDASRQALYRYIIGKELNAEQYAVLPRLVKDFEFFKASRSGKVVIAVVAEVPDVPFQMLTALNLTTEDWTTIALNGNWQFVRMNLNTFARHGVFDDKKVTRAIAAKLKDKEAIRTAKVFPYQLLVAYLNADVTVPNEIKNALQEAMETATQNVPTFSVDGVLVFPDVSGSMGSPVSGYRAGATTAITCNHVSALFAAAILRKNKDSKVIPFDTRVHKVDVNAFDSVMTNAKKLAIHGGGTSCSVALAYANQHGMKADLVVYVSDNESWVDAKGGGHSYYNSPTETMKQWKLFKQRNPDAKMVNINITPTWTTQASNDKDILNIGGFSDTIFEVIEQFVSGNGDQWVEVINKINL